MAAINNAWNGTKDSDNQKYLMQLEADLDRKYQMAMQANTVTATGSTLTSGRTVDPYSDPYRNEVQVLIRKVENGYTARIDGKAYIASSIEELNGLVTVKLLALGGS
jgi:ABC-type amino acid transport substrate-binding protein